MNKFLLFTREVFANCCQLYSFYFILSLSFIWCNIPILNVKRVANRRKRNEKRETVKIRCSSAYSGHKRLSMGKFIGIIESLPHDHRFGSKFEYDVWVRIVLIKWIKLDFETPDGFYEVEGWYCTVLSLQKWFKNKVHYKISQFYRRKYSVGVWLPVHRWFIYRRLHRRNKNPSVYFKRETFFLSENSVCKTIGKWFFCVSDRYSDRM